MSLVHRERLVENAFLQEVMKGWLISASPRAGDSTPWYASFWEFSARYSPERFGNEWHLSAEGKPAPVAGFLFLDHSFFLSLRMQ